MTPDDLERQAREAAAQCTETSALAARVRRLAAQQLERAHRSEGRPGLRVIRSGLQATLGGTLLGAAWLIQASYDHPARASAVASAGLFTAGAIALLVIITPMQLAMPGGAVSGGPDRDIPQPAAAHQPLRDRQPARLIAAGPAPRLTVSQAPQPRGHNPGRPPAPSPTPVPSPTASTTPQPTPTPTPRTSAPAPGPSPTPTPSPTSKPKHCLIWLAGICVKLS